MDKIVNALRGTLDKTFLTNLRDYIKINGSCNDFILISDYCVNDKSKPNDVIAFTISPREMYSPELMIGIDTSIPKDIKKTKNIDDKTIATLNDRRFFHIAFVLDDISGYLHAAHVSDKYILLKNIEGIMDMLTYWSANQPKGAAKFNEQLKKFKNVKNLLERPTANIKLFRRLVLTSFLASLIAFYLSKESCCKNIIWFPDRDVIHEAFTGIYIDIFEIMHWGLCLDKLPSGRITPRIGRAVYESGEKRMWFDALIRLPDFIAGTVASWDFESNLTSAEKHAILLDKVFVENPYCMIIRLNMSKTSYSFGINTVGRRGNASTSK